MAEATAKLQDELAALRRAAVEVATVMAALDESCARAIHALEEDAAPTEVYRRSQFAQARDDVFATLDSFSRQLTVVRAEAIRLHVDLEGRSLTEVAALIGRSRQFVTRLYRLAADT